MNMRFASINSLTSGKSDFVEITPQLTGLTACTCHSGLVASEPVLFGEWSAKKIQSSIESAWQVILAAEPNHIIIHPVIPAQWTKKATAAFWHFCAEVTRWQDDRRDGYLVTIMYPAHSGFWLSQSSRSLKWRRSMTFCTFKNKGEQQHGEISFLTNAPEGSLDRLESLGEGFSSEETLDPRFAVLLSQCLLSNHKSDLRQGFLFEDIFEDFEDGTLCALCLRSEHNSEALPVLPSSEEYSMLSDNSRGKLPKPLQFVAPQRFVTSSLVQALSYIDNLLPGMELEIHTTTSAEAVALRPMIKNVRVLTLPYLEFEFCNVYRGTQGKTFPLIHRHPDAVVLLWCKGDHDHVFFVRVAQLLPCLQDMNLADWSMVVFWNESAGSGSKKGPDVGLDFTDQPTPSPHVPQQPPVTPGDDMDYPGYDDPHVDMPVDDEDMPPPNSAPEPDLNNDPIELGSGGNPPPHPPGGGCRTIRMKMVDIRQEAVRMDRDLAMGRLRTSQPFRWSTMKSRLLLEVLLMLLGLRRNMQIRTRCLVRLCRGRHRLHRLSLFLFLLILIFRFLKVLDRHRQGMCHRLVLVVSTQMIRPRRSRGLSWDRR